MHDEPIRISAQILGKNHSPIAVGVCRYHHQLNTPSYRISLLMYISDDKCVKALMSDKDCHLRITIEYCHRNIRQYLTGTVIEVEQLVTASPHQFNWRVECQHESYRQWQDTRSGIFYGATLVDVVTHFANEQAKTYTQTKCDPLWQEDSRYPLHPSLTQYDESDGAFLTRQCRRHGIWWAYHQTAEGVQWHLGDNNTQFMPGPTVNAFMSQTHRADQPGIFNTLEHSGRFREDINYYDQVILNQLNEETPTELMRAEHIFREGPRVLSHRSPFVALTQTQLDTVCRTTVDSLRLRERRLAGQFQGIVLDAGQRITLNVIDDDLKRIYDLWGIDTDCVIEEVDYSFVGRRTSVSGEMHYEQHHTFKAFPLHTAYRPHFDVALDALNAPKHHGVMTGVTTYIPDSHSEVTVTPDDIGRMPLRFPYDYSINANAHSRYTRTCLLTNGPNASISFPLYKDSPCVCVFSNGDLDRPIFIGCISNEQTGHLHSDTRQLQSNWALPQGQYIHMTHPKDESITQLAIGTRHNCHREHSYLTLDKAGAHDFTLSTTGHYEHHVTEDYVDLFGIPSGDIGAPT